MSLNVFPRLLLNYLRKSRFILDSGLLPRNFTFQRGDSGMFLLVVNDYNICRLLGLSFILAIVSSTSCLRILQKCHTEMSVKSYVTKAQCVCHVRV